MKINNFLNNYDFSGLSMEDENSIKNVLASVITVEDAIRRITIEDGELALEIKPEFNVSGVVNSILVSLGDLNLGMCISKQTGDISTVRVSFTSKTVIDAKSIFKNMNRVDAEMKQLRTDCFQSIISTYSQIITELEVNEECAAENEYTDCAEIGIRRIDVDSARLIRENQDIVKTHDAIGSEDGMYQDIAIRERKKRAAAENEIAKLKLELECMKKLDDANSNLQVTYKEMLVDALFLK